jgi:hypothetical protein
MRPVESLKLGYKQGNIPAKEETNFSQVLKII